MDSNKLSQDTAALLGALLPYLWHDNPPSMGGAERDAMTLWKAVRPELERLIGGLSAATQAAEDPTAIKLTTLSSALNRAFAASPSLKSQAEALMTSGPLADLAKLSAKDGIEKQSAEIRQRVANLNRRSALGPMAQKAHQGVPACQVCGRQDASLRVVVYPYVVSLLLVTFRRAFTGIWCWQHQLWYRTLATLITASIGWIGIPFGLFFTPIVLFTLAKGGDQPADINQRMLVDLAEHNLRSGGSPGEAIRALEAALTFSRTPTLEARLKELYSLYSAESRRRAIPSLIVFPPVILVAAVIGLLAGLFDYAVTDLLGFLGDELPTVIAVMTWIPYAIALVVSTMLLSQIVESALRRTQTHQAALGVALAVVATLVAFYEVPAASSFAFNLSAQPLSATFASVPAAVGTLLYPMLFGGVDVLSFHVSGGQPYNIIYLILWFVMGTLCVVSTSSTARRVTAGERWANENRDPSARRSALHSGVGWVGVIGTLLVCGALFPAMTFLGALQYGSLQTLEAVTAALEKLENGDVDTARAELETARDGEPNSFAPHLGLAIVDVYIGNCEGAMANAQQAQTFAPQLAQYTAWVAIGEAHACYEHIDDAIAAYERSLEYDTSDNTAFLKLGLLYMSKGDMDRSKEYYESAVELDPEWSAGYASLAIVAYLTGDTAAQQEALEQALSKEVDESAEYSTLAYYYLVTNDFVKAEEQTRQGMEVSGADESYQLFLCRVLNAEKKSDECIAIADKILSHTGSYYLAEAHTAKVMSLIEQGKLDEAGLEANTAVDLKPDFSGPHYHRAYLYQINANYAQAIDEAQQAIEIDPYDSSSYAIMALAYMESGDADQAEEAAETSLELWPKGDIPFYVLGKLAMDRGDKAAAIEAFEMFLKLTWDRAYVRDLAARAQEYLDELK